MGYIMLKNILEPGEYPLSSYQVQFVDWVNSEWHGNDCWLRATVTNRRLLVFSPGIQAVVAQTILPGDIRKVWNVCLQGRDGILVALKDGRRLYLLVDWSQGSKLVKDINSMLTIPLVPRIAPRMGH
jgi:hypothetical protein